MRMWMTMLIVSVLWLCPVMIEAGAAGERPAAQQQLMTKENLKLVQQRLQAEGVYAGPVDGEMNAQTEAALRAYQAKQGLTVSGTADEATLKQLQLELPTVRQGETN